MNIDIDIDILDNKYLLSPYVDHMQVVETDSIRAQNKAGQPIAVPELMFFNIRLYPPLKNQKPGTELKLDNKVVYQLLKRTIKKKKRGTNKCVCSPKRLRGWQPTKMVACLLGFALKNI